MDEVIFEEFKGTGNMELQLDRRISNRRIFPPSTSWPAAPPRRPPAPQGRAAAHLDRRKHLADMNPVEAMEFVKKHMEGTKQRGVLVSMNG